MFEQKKTAPWYKSPIVLIAALAVVVLGAVVGFLVFRSGGSDESHYAALEQHRQQQAAQPPPAATATPVATATPIAAASPGASPEQLAPTTSSGRNYWTTFRGARRDGTYALTPVSTNWPAQGLSPIWKQPVGLGFASFAIADGRAFTLEQRRGQEVAAAYDVATGRELWTQAWNAEFYESNGAGPRSTPTWDQGRVYALGATGELRCLDANNGTVIWGKNILTENQAENLPWAMAASPLIVDDKVIVLPGGAPNKSVVAYNKMTGAPVWKVLNDTQAYVSPMLVELNGRRQIMVVSSSRVVGLVPENGALLWSYPWNTNSGINVSQPIVIDKNRFFISSGYGKGAALVEVKGSGQSFTATTIWENINMKNKFNSSVFHNGYVYGLDEGILTCLDVNTGERKWKGGRYGYGQVLLAGDHLILTSETGELALVKAAPDQYSEVARFPALQGKTWNYPAIADGRLLVRNATEMAAYDISRK